MRVQDFAQYATLTKGREVIHGFIWDTLAFTNATVTLNFFQQTLAATTLDVTNMRNAGQLPYPFQFLVRAVRCIIKQQPESVNQVAPAGIQTGAINNAQMIGNTGVLKITHGAKEYGIYPLWMLSSGGGPYGQSLVNNILIAGGYADHGGLGLPHARNVFTLAKPMLIETSMNFLYNLSWPAGALATITRTVNICLCLEGDLIRPVQ